MDVNWIPFNTNFANKCLVCGHMIKTGDDCEWLKANGIRHPNCGQIYDRAMNLRDDALKQFVQENYLEAKKTFKLSTQVLNQIDLAESGSKFLELSESTYNPNLLPWPKNEDLHNEFKSSWQIDYKAEEIIKSGDKFAIEQIKKKAGDRIKDMKKDIVKSVCAFLNNDGGSIWLGVSDNAEPIGLQKDLKHFSKPGKNNQDLLRQDISNNIRKYLVRDFPTEISFEEHSIEEDKDTVLEIKVGLLDASDPPAYVTDGNSRIPYIRFIDGDHAYTDMEKWMLYIKKRFPDFVP